MTDFTCSKQDFETLVRGVCALAAEGSISLDLAGQFMVTRANWRNNTNRYSWYDELRLQIEPYAEPEPEPAVLDEDGLPEERTDVEREMGSAGVES